MSKQDDRPYKTGWNSEHGPIFRAADGRAWAPWTFARQAPDDVDGGAIESCPGCRGSMWPGEDLALGPLPDAHWVAHRKCAAAGIPTESLRDGALGVLDEFSA